MHTLSRKLPFVAQRQGVVNIGRLSLCCDTHTITVGDQKHHLRNKLFKLLKHLYENHNRLLHRHELIKLIWDQNHYIGEKGLTHAVCMLRNLIKQDLDCGVSIETIPKTGYRLKISARYLKNQNDQAETEAECRKVDTSMPNWWPSSISPHSY